VGVPQYLVSLIYFVVVILPSAQVIISSLLVLLGTSLLVVVVYRFQQKATKVVYNYISLDMMPSSL
jgi:hypothetical protein